MGRTWGGNPNWFSGIGDSVLGGGGGDCAAWSAEFGKDVLDSEGAACSELEGTSVGGATEDADDSGCSVLDGDPAASGALEDGPGADSGIALGPLGRNAGAGIKP